MMKKLLILCLLGGCFSSVFAQGGQAGGVARGVKAIVNKGAVQRQINNALNSKLSSTQFIKIYHFPDHPVVPLLSPVQPSEHLSDAPSPQAQILPARVLLPDELLEDRVMYPSFRMYVPRDFLDAEESLYRGMKLSEIGELKNILLNGLETDKSHYAGKIFVSPSLQVAMGYALPKLWDRWNDEIQVDMPVLVRIALTKEIWEKYRPAQFSTEWIFQKSIPANMVSDVMILLEVNGVPGWYKAVLNNGEVGLLAVPGIKADTRESW